MLLEIEDAMYPTGKDLQITIDEEYTKVIDVGTMRALIELLIFAEGEIKQDRDVKLRAEI